MKEKVSVIIRMQQKTRDKWKVECAKKKVSYEKWIENSLINKA